jgi:hypothetical protein
MIQPISWIGTSHHATTIVPLHYKMKGTAANRVAVTLLAGRAFQVNSN